MGLCGECSVRALGGSTCGTLVFVLVTPHSWRRVQHKQPNNDHPSPDIVCFPLCRAVLGVDLTGARHTPVHLPCAAGA